MKTSREVLSQPAATTSVNQILKAQGDGKPHVQRWNHRLQR